MILNYTLIIILLWIIFTIIGKNSLTIRKIVSIILCLIFILQSGFRDYLHMMNDTIVYLDSFEAVKKESLSDIISSFTLSYDNYAIRDPGYTVFTKLFQLLSDNFRVYLIAIACIIAIPLCRILYKYIPTVNGLFMAAIIYQGIFAGFFNTGIRQTIALGICLFSIIYYERRKPLPHYLLIFIAYTIHSSALLFAPLYLIRKIDPRKLLYCAICITPIAMLFAKRIIAFLGAGTIFEMYAVNSTNNLGTPVFTTMVAFVAVAVAIMYKKLKLYFKDSTFFIQCIAIALMLTPTSWVDSNFLRLTYYYLIFLLPLYPMLIEAVFVNKTTLKYSVYLISTLGLIILMSQYS